MLFSNKQNEKTWLIAGLGNPGPAYHRTRHNAGFCAVERLAEKLKIDFKTRKCDGYIGQGRLDGQKVILVKPLTFMNRSGQCIGALARFYKIPNERVLVFSDDVSLPVGKLRLRAKGSAGGHNGLKDVIACLPGEDFPRIRIGVGQKPQEQTDLADWVLGKISKEDQPAYEESLDRAAEAAVLLMQKGMADAMNRYNG